MTIKTSVLLSTILLVCRFSLHAYYFISPYSYCASDPINYIDPSGKDIVVLNKGYYTSQHLAMLIQNQKGKWQYYSVNGNNVINSSTGEHTGGRPFNDVAVGSWDTPQQFLNSSYNVVKGKPGKTDLNVNNYGYSEGYRITTTPEQDAIMRDGFKEIAETEYDIVTNNCATAVQQVMVEAGIPVSIPWIKMESKPVHTSVGTAEVVSGVKIKCVIIFVPSLAFKSIVLSNPGGEYLQKQ